MIEWFDCMKFVKTNSFIFFSQMINIDAGFEAARLFHVQKITKSNEYILSGFVFHRSEYLHGQKKSRGRGSVNLSVVKW